MYPAFTAAVGTCLQNWSALQFAVQQQTGGPESKNIAEWMVGAVEQYFSENDELDPDEVSDLLSTLMDQELNTEVQDESNVKLGEVLCRFFKLCASGKEVEVLDEVSKMPNFTLGSYSVQEESIEPFANAPGVMEAQMSDLQIDERGMEAEDGVEEPPRELTEMEKQQLQDEADGWTVKRKGNKKR